MRLATVTYRQAGRDLTLCHWVYHRGFVLRLYYGSSS